MKSRRFVAFIIDAIIIAVILVALFNIILSCFNVRFFYRIIALFAWALLICKDCFNGMSVGKRLIGIQVIDSNNMQIASPVKCVIRNLFYFLTFIELFAWLFYFKNMRPGDYFARAKVILRDKSLQKVKFAKTILAIGYVFIGLTIMITILYLRASSLGVLEYLYQLQ